MMEQTERTEQSENKNSLRASASPLRLCGEDSALHKLEFDLLSIEPAGWYSLPLSNN
jgi:hypothetical protein